MGNRKRSFKNFLLDPRFQLKYATLIALTGGLIFGVMAWFFFDKVRENSQLAAIDIAALQSPPPAPTDAPEVKAPGVAPKVKIDRQPVQINAEPLKMEADPAPVGEAVGPVPPPSDVDFHKELRDQLDKQDAPILWWLAGSLLVLVTALFLIGILATHRIVGPIYVVNMYVRKIMAGEPVRQRALRKGDEFQQLFDDVNEMAAALTDERRNDVERVERALTMLTARVEGLEGEITRAQLLAWLDDCLASAREMVEEKRRYVADSSGPGPIPPPT